MEDGIVLVGAKSRPSAVAGFLAGHLREGASEATLRAMGPEAISVADKAVALARGFVAPEGKDLVCIPALAEVKVDGETRHAMLFIVRNSR